MKIMVLAKQVPDTWQERTLDMETGMLVRDGAAEPVPDEISERVMEVALGWRDAGTDAEIVALTVGPEDSSKTLRKMLAMGADSAVQITDDALVDEAIARHHPHAADAEHPALALYEAVIAAQAALVRFHEAAQQQIQQLNDISSNIHTSGVQYTSTDEDQTSALSSAMQI